MSQGSENRHRLCQGTTYQTITFEQARAVNDFFHTDTDRQHAADTLSVLSHPFPTEDEHTKGRLEVQNVVNNFSEYERIKKEKMGHPPITGIEDIRCKMYLRLAMKILLSGRLPLLLSILASSIHQCTSGEWYYTQIWPPTQRKLRQR